MTDEEAVVKIGEHQKAIVESAQKTLFADFDSDLTEALGVAIEALKERKTGKWITTEDGRCLCNRCCWRLIIDYNLFSYPNYCPRCGAKMEE